MDEPQVRIIEACVYADDAEAVADLIIDALDSAGIPWAYVALSHGDVEDMHGRSFVPTDDGVPLEVLAADLEAGVIEGEAGDSQPG